MKCQMGSEQVDASLLDVWGHPRMHTVEMAQGAVGFAGENGNGGVLMPFAVLAAWVVLESAVVGAEEAQLAPAARAGVRAQSGDISGGDHGEVKILSEMMGDAVGAVEPGGTHRASLGLPLSVHQVIDDERAIRFREEFAKADGAYGRVTTVVVARALFKLIVRNRSALREMAAQLSHPFALAHELDLRQSKFLALG